MSAARIAINLRSTVFGRHRRRLLVGEYIAVLTRESQISGAMRLRSLITDGLTRNGAAAHHGAYLCGNLTVALENAPKPFTYGGVRKRGLTMSIRCWLNSVAVPVMLLVAGGLFASARAQDYPSVDCNNPYYYQYCQQYYAWYQAYYSWYQQGYAPYIYDQPYPYYDYGVPVGVGVGVGLGFGFRHHGFRHGGGFHGGFHRGGGGGGHSGGGHGGGGPSRHR